MGQLDKLSDWLKDAVQGGSRGSMVSAKDIHAKERKGRGPAIQHGVLKIIPIGGLEEVGKNSMIVEYENDILAIDMGFQFPEEELLGVDYIIPDIQYLVERRHRIKGILITHGHLDHIGALPFVLKDLGFPMIYGTSLSIGLIQRQLEERHMLKQARFKVIDPKQVYHFGQMQVDFFRVNHSIPDAVGLLVSSPAGSLVHTGDFKFDFTPADGVEADIKKMGEIGKRGVNILFSDSTNALKPGHTISERMVAENLEEAISGAEGRIIIASFASLIGRIQQILEFAKHHRRKVFLSGRSLEHNFEIAKKLGFLKFQKDAVMSIKQVNNYPDREVLVLTTGGQGEPMAALSRMATNAHAQIKIKSGDMVVVSSSPIPGNEKQVSFLIDSLARLGAKVVSNQMMDVHASGHGQQEDLKLMMSLMRPENLVPIHGNYVMRRAHGDLGLQMGLAADHVHMMDNGNVIEIHNKKVSFRREDIKVRYVVMEGEERGDLGSQVLKERGAMAQNGMILIGFKVREGRLHDKPIIETRGILLGKDRANTMKEFDRAIREGILKQNKREAKSTRVDYENSVRSNVSGYILKRFNKRPLVVTVTLFG